MTLDYGSIKNKLGLKLLFPNCNYKHFEVDKSPLTFITAACKTGLATNRKSLLQTDQPKQYVEKQTHPVIYITQQVYLEIKGHRYGYKEHKGVKCD